MTRNSVSSGIMALALVLLVLISVIPVSGADATTTGVAASKPFISATVSSTAPVVGDDVTISGVATGGNLTDGVQIWIFAGEYINVSTVPVNADGTFSKTYSTTGFPPATYYVIVQSPSTNGQLDIVLQSTGPYAGEVVNVKTGQPIFTFTGTGSLQDADAVTALSNAFNQPGVDDIYTKLTFQLVAPATGSSSATTVVSPAATTAKSPVSPVTILAGLGIAGIFCVLCLRR